MASFLFNLSRHLSWVLGSLLLCPFAAGAVRYVTPNGSPDNPGTEAQPWTLSHALSAARAGDLVLVRGGDYKGTFWCRASASGTAERPIIIRAFPGERAHLDAESSQRPVLTVQCANTWFWGLEISYSDTKRISAQEGSAPNDINRFTGVMIDQSAPDTSNVRFINMIVHDTRDGFGLWKEARNSEIYGSIVFYAGWDGPDRGHGHGIYSQNETGEKRIQENGLFSNFGYGLHVFSSQDLLQNYYVEGNIAFDNGRLSKTSGFSSNFLVGAGGDIPKKLTFRNNYGYFSSDQEGGSSQVGSTAGCEQIRLSGNYLAAPRGTALTKPTLCRDIQIDSTVFVGRLQGFSASDFSGNTYYSQRPSGTRVFVRPNKYEPGRAHIVVYNWDGKASVPVDVSAVLRKGDKWELRDVQNIFAAPLRSGVYDGNPIEVPTALTAVTSTAGSTPAPPVHTTSEFNVFLLTSPERSQIFSEAAHSGRWRCEHGVVPTRCCCSRFTHLNLRL